MFKNFHFNLKYYNFRLLILIYALTALGIAVIGSAAPGEGYQLKQIIGLCGCTIAMIFITLVDYHWILKWHWPIYAVCCILLLIVLKWGKNVNGATRWIRITNGINIQPSEFAKIFLIVFWAWLFGRNPEVLKKWKNFFIACGLTLIPLLLIVSEPDLSTTILVTALFIITLFIAGFSYKKFGIILAALIPVLAAVIIYIQAVPPTETNNQNKLLKYYQYCRIMAFINPAEYDNQRYQQDNSVLAIGSGQLTGKGLYNDSTDSVKNGNYLAEPQTDFIFAIVGEELGFVGGCVVIGLLVLITIECIITGIRALDMSGRIICFGMASIICLQTFINIGVATELLPNTGIPLPFVSYGLSSLLAMYAGMGFVLNVGIRKHASLEEIKYEHRLNRT